jgi:hypothetical protein
MPRPELTEAMREINELAEMFDGLCVHRHERGSEEYGPIAFLDNDVVRMMVEELADLANYARMEAVKLMMMERRVQEAGIDPSDQIGAQAFRGVGEGWQ